MKREGRSLLLREVEETCRINREETRFVCTGLGGEEKNDFHKSAKRGANFDRRPAKGRYCLLWFHMEGGLDLAVERRGERSRV